MKPSFLNLLLARHLVIKEKKKNCKGDRAQAQCGGKASASASNMASERKTKLAKNLLRMNFMQRGLDSETKKQLEEEERKMISDEHWYLDLPELKEKESFIIEEQSFSLCEDLLYGRMSFRGFNPEVEVLNIIASNLKKNFSN